MFRARWRKIFRDVWARKSRTAMASAAPFVAVLGAVALPAPRARPTGGPSVSIPARPCNEPLSQHSVERDAGEVGEPEHQHVPLAGGGADAHILVAVIVHREGHILARIDYEQLRVAGTP